MQVTFPCPYGGITQASVNPNGFTKCQNANNETWYTDLFSWQFTNEKQASLWLKELSEASFVVNRKIGPKFKS